MSTVVSTKARSKRRLALPTDCFTQIVLALTLGIFCGLFFGEINAPLKEVGVAYVRLLQMTVLPYVLASLIAGIGRLEPTGCGLLGLRAVILIVLLWAVSWLTSFMIPLSYPDWDTGSFFSTTLPSEAPLDLMSMFIPANIFESLSESIVPAVVVFSISLGLALMAMREKQTILNALEVIETALGRVMSFIARLAPLGIFAMAAATAGTIEFEELNRLQIYLWTYVAAWALLGFVTLPVLVALATPFSYLDVLRHARTAMITAFAVNTVLVVLPLIAEECKKLLKEAELGTPETNSAVNVLAPTAYTVPTAGTPISLAFILFAAWFVGAPLTLDQYPMFGVLGIPSSFGGMWLALPFLLDYFRLPSDMVQLFVVGSVITSNFWTSLAAMHGVVLCLLAACAMTGRLNWMRLIIGGGASIVLAAVFFLVLGFAFRGILPEENIGEQRLRAMQLVEEPVPITEIADPAPLSVEARGRPRLTVIRNRGSLRVGVHAGRLPFVFRNGGGELVGLDMELMHALARDLGVGLEISQVNWGDGIEWLDSGRLDMIAGGVSITPTRALDAAFTRPYVDETPGFLIRDESRRDFATLQTIRQLPSLRLGVMPDYFHRQIQQAFPNAEFVEIRSPKPFLRGELPDVDALLFSAEMGSAWTLIYPQFMAVVPIGFKPTVPVGFALPSRQSEFQTFLNNWLGVQIKIGMVEELYRHWILGKPITDKAPRWSIIRDVLHWVD